MVSTKQKEKILGNPNQQDLINVVMSAVYVGNGKAAEEAVQKINEEFILIRKSDLPQVKVQPRYSPIQGEYRDVATARTASYTVGSSDFYYRRALDVLAISLYAEGMEKEKAWKLLHPLEAYWDYESQTAPIRKQIDVVVDLMTQVDELKNKK
jgi:hypothetical protein